jgi:PAS domain S-box-containing protein
MHPQLRRQLQRLRLDEHEPPSLPEWRVFLARMTRSYEQADREREAIEHTLGISSDELRQLLDTRRASANQLARERDKLRSLNWFLDSIIENIPDMISVKDASTLEYVRVNRAAESLLGISREELLGRGDHDFFPKEEADSFLVTERRALAERAPVLVEDEPIATRKRGRRSLCTTKIPIFDERGEPIYVLGISRDITEQKETHARLEQAKEHERASRAKSAFLANMSHELRTPLNSIIGFSEILEDRVPGPLNETQERYVANVLTSAKHLLRLIGEILDLSKLEAGRMRLVFAETDLSAALRRVAGIVQPLAAKKDIAIQIEDADRELTVEADEQRIDQILYNLLSNAVKFTLEGGRIDIQATRSGESIEVTVRDTGIGIAAQDLDRIFLEFEQADSSYTRTQQGTGLGLALTRRLVELHGGRIGVTSVLGEGSAFTFAIPVRQTQ